MNHKIKTFLVLASLAMLAMGSTGCKKGFISETTGRLLLYSAVSVAYNEAVENGIEIGEQRVDVTLERIAKIKSVISHVSDGTGLPDAPEAPLLTVNVFTDRKALKRFAVDIGIALAYQYAVERGAEIPAEKLTRTYNMLCELEDAIMFASGRTGGIAILSGTEEPSFDLLIK